MRKWSQEQGNLVSDRPDLDLDMDLIEVGSRLDLDLRPCLPFFLLSPR
jgi:hypothetical protein